MQVEENVLPSDIQTFRCEVLFAQRVAALAVKVGESLPFETIIQLSAEAKAVYMLASLESRGLDLIEQHQSLWKRTADFFSDVVSIWESVPTDEELLCAYRRELKRLAEITKERVEFYSVDGERRDYRQRKLD